MPTLSELTPKPETRVAIIVDKSGSMSSLSKFAVDTYNEQLAELRKNSKDQRITISLIFFDSDVEIKYFNESLAVAQDLKYEEYQTGTMTALNDAVGVTIDKFKALDGCQDENVSHLVVIITDGHENASKEYHQKTIANNIDLLQKDGWTFTYLGANVDVKKVAQDYNLNLGNTMSYQPTADGLRASSVVTSKGLGNYFGARTRGVRASTSFYAGDDLTPVDEADSVVENKIEINIDAQELADAIKESKIKIQSKA